MWAACVARRGIEMRVQDMLGNVGVGPELPSGFREEARSCRKTEKLRHVETLHTNREYIDP